MSNVDYDFSLAVRAVSMAFVHYRSFVVRTTYGVGPTEGSALGELFLHGPLTPTELARRLHLTTPAMTEALDRLERAGHARRDRHPTDRRKVLISLRTETLASLERSAPAFAEVLAPALEGLDDSDRRRVVDVLDRSVKIMEADIRTRLGSVR